MKNCGMTEIQARQIQQNFPFLLKRREKATLQSSWRTGNSVLGIANSTIDFSLVNGTMTSLFLSARRFSPRRKCACSMKTSKRTIRCKLPTGTTYNQLQLDKIADSAAPHKRCYECQRNTENRRCDSPGQTN